MYFRSKAGGWGKLAGLGAVIGTWVASGFGAGCASQPIDGGAGGGATTTATTDGTTVASTTQASTVASTSTGSLCAEDCTKIQTPDCLKSVCNDGSYQGQIGSCVVVPDDGAACDDKAFCTTNDTCKGGQCVGGPQNDCGMTPPECNVVVCNEGTASCSLAPADDDTSCTAADLCTVNSVCKAGVCKGSKKDCTFSTLVECNTVTCNPANGKCEGTPDTSKNGSACELDGDLCKTGKTCMAGQCTGGNAKDCSSYTHDCLLGVCSAVTGNCMGQAIPSGGMCASAADECNQGICDANGMCNAVATPGVSCPSAVDQCHTGTCSAAGVCMPVQLAAGTMCNDGDSCTKQDACDATGKCSGVAVAGCNTYLSENFETCAGSAWTYTGDWACGAPTVVGPMAHGGSNVIGTVLNANYHDSDKFATTTATSGAINLASATDPILTFYMWMNAESGFDGANLSISQDGGAFNVIGAGTFCTAANLCTVVNSSKAYNKSIDSPAQAVWSGDESSAGWQKVTIKLAPYVGHSVRLRFNFRSDSIDNFAGVYVDDIRIAEANTVPLSIDQLSIPNAYVNTPYAVNMTHSGGTSAAVWSITGGTNAGWLSISPTGALSGTPTAANMGPASVTIHVEEPTLPSNFMDQTYNITVGGTPIYAQSFDGGCPASWVLAGDWECGTPTAVGPAKAFGGTNCIATKIGAVYSANDAYATTTATTPAISLAGATMPQVDFEAYVETEGLTYDGFDLEVSTDGGANYAVVTSVTPAYPLTIAGQKAWGGTNTSFWAPYHADLSAFAGQNVLLRFAFRSDFSTQLSGVYIDNFVVHQ